MPGVGERELLKLKADGWQSPLIDLRLRFSQLESVRKVVAMFAGRERVYPGYLPTQKSGRWSITHPPLANLSPACVNPACEWVQQGIEHPASRDTCWSLRDLIIPDVGHYFLKFDWSAVEARYAAAYSGDDEDLDLFASDADIHTVTYCKMAGLPLPPNIMDPYGSPECETWRQQTGMHTKGCWQRQSGKTNRYALAYAASYLGIFEAKDIDLLMRAAGTDRKGIEAMAKAYLASKPKLQAWKRQMARQIYETAEVRTPIGRRKRLFVTSEEYVAWRKYGTLGPAAKEGINHMAQAQVADMMNLTIIAIKRRWPVYRLAYQAHDGLTMVFPLSVRPWPEIREVVERDWPIGNGRVVHSTAEWGVVQSDGTHGEVREN